MAGAGLLVVGFVALLKGLRLVDRSRDVIATARRSLVDLRNPQLEDSVKEVVLRRHTVRLFGLFFQLLFGGAAALGLPAGVVWLLSRTGLWSFSDVLRVAADWQFLLASTVLVVLFFRLVRSR